jgi:tetratricopeptide (TPR) repeat protein
MLDDFSPNIEAGNFRTVGDNPKNEVKLVDYSLLVNIGYTLYDSDGKVCHWFRGKASSFMATQTNPGALIAGLLAPGIKNNAAELNQTAAKAVENALRDFFPYTNTLVRPLYTDDELNPTVNDMLSNNYHRADSVLRSLINLPNADLAAKAAYNLAVLLEAQGKTDEAQAMLAQSINQSNNRFARLMLRYYAPGN